jgi:hypothetical protein
VVGGGGGETYLPMSHERHPLSVTLFTYEKNYLLIRICIHIAHPSCCTVLPFSGRYHFAGLHGEHYERVPYRNHQTGSEIARHVTRYAFFFSHHYCLNSLKLFICILFRSPYFVPVLIQETPSHTKYLKSHVLTKVNSSGRFCGS